MHGQSPYEMRGYANRNEYLNSLAEQYDIDSDTLEFASNLLGEDEDFDMLPMVLDDLYSEEWIEHLSW